jgi:hypothetical protein
VSTLEHTDLQNVRATFDRIFSIIFITCPFVCNLITYLQKKRLANKETITYFLLIACHVGDFHLLDFYLVTWELRGPNNLKI